jgi:DNA modification methylase
LIPIVSSSRAFLFHGDAGNVRDVLAPNSVDALVCDPPAGIGFMGKEWDRNKGGRDAWVSWLAGIMAGVFSVLKPGAHGLVWALPRTSHWTGYALENAGFEVRDRVSHFFGTGFPQELEPARGPRHGT